MTDHDAHAPPAACENCASALIGVYCHVCGQHAHSPLHHFGHALEEVFESFWHLDGRIFRTLRDLFVPGRVAADYLAGHRVRYVAPLAEQIDCHLSVARGGEKVHGVMSCSAQTLLRLLDAADWLPIERALPADWPLNSALALGSVSLTLSELSSVRPGDVLLPTRPLFDSAGHGRVQIGHRQWAVEMYTHNDTVRLRLLYEEAIRDTGQ